jgi:Dyp-type peroxidase family
VGASAPDRWVGNLRARDQVHMLCSLFATTADDLERHSAALRVLLGAGFAETYSHDGTALPDGYVHFGYRDGISQPALEGGPPPAHPYPAALGRNGRSPAGDFLLGYENSFQSSYCPDLARTPLGRDGSFGAFRILRQDVRGFAAYLAQAAPKAGLSEDELAAKFLGRWRNGVPLTLSPNSDAPLPPDRLNQFLYHRTAPGQSRPDPSGLGCPVGSHIRRTNPRDDTVAGGSTQQARLIRRNLPYGPAFDPSAPPDDIERGLVGYFINADFHAQFQFLMSQWVNLDNFTASQPITGRDPLIGANDPVTSAFALAEGKSSPCPVTGFNRFVTTRGSAYVFFPSATALRGLACGGSS